MQWSSDESALAESDNTNLSLSATLGTVQVRVELQNGTQSRPLRGFCDTGSQVNLVTEACVQRLGLTRTKTRIPINGIGAVSTAAGLVSLKLSHREVNSPFILAKALIVAKISSRLPDRRFDMPFDGELAPKELADPLCNIPGDIDLLLGAGVWASWASIVREPIKRKVNNQHKILLDIQRQ